MWSIEEILIFHPPAPGLNPKFSLAKLRYTPPPIFNRLLAT